MELEIKPGAATDDAAQIEEIVSKIENDMQTLNDAFTKTAEGTQLEWAEQLRSNWGQYRDTDIPEAMAEMRTAAHNLQAAVQAAVAYSQEN